MVRISDWSTVIGSYLDDESETELLDHKQPQLRGILERHQHILVVDGGLQVVDAEVLQPLHVELHSQHVDLHHAQHNLPLYDIKYTEL